MKNLNISIGFSKRYTALILLLHLALLTVVWVGIVMPVMSKWVVFLLVFYSMAFLTLRDVLQLLPSSWNTVIFEMEGLRVVTHGTDIFSGTLAKSTFVSPYLIVLCVVPDGRKWPLCRVIFPDAMEIDSYRKLCVRLRYS